MPHDSTGFDDIFFPIRVDFGVGGGEKLPTNIHFTGGGREWRNQPADEPRNQIDGEGKNFTLVEADKVVAFFRGRQLQTFGFRFKDWTDFTSIKQPALPVADGVRTTFNMYKRYPDLIEDSDRRIALIVDPTRTEWEFTTPPGSEISAHGPIITPLAVYINDVLRAGSEYTIDYRNGRIIFNGGAEPNATANVTWDGEFHNAMRLDTPGLNKVLVEHNVLNFEQLSFMEILAWDILETPDA